MASLGGAYEFIEFKSNSKSGAFFFYSRDGEADARPGVTRMLPGLTEPCLMAPLLPAGKFMIKTQSSAESKFLRRILAHYYQVRRRG